MLVKMIERGIMYLKRTVLLSSKNAENKILLIVEKSEMVRARVKGASKFNELWAVFKFNNAPQVFQKLDKEGEEFSCSLAQFTNVNDNICCAVFASPSLDSIYYGGTDNKEEFYLELIKTFDEFVRQINYEKDGIEELFESDDEEVEKQIDSELTNQLVYECLTKCEQDKCKDCVYKKAFYERKNELLSTAKMQEEEELKEDKQQKNKEFFYSVEGSLNDLFNSYPNDEVLEEKLQNSKFAKVDYEGDGNFYSVGVIYDSDGQEEYICYAIYGKKDCPPPKELCEFSQFLPIDEENGYYLMYQNVIDGQSIIMQNAETN